MTVSRISIALFSFCLVFSVAVSANAGFEQIYDSPYFNAELGLTIDFTPVAANHEMDAPGINFFVPGSPEAYTELNGGWDVTWTDTEEDTNYFHATTRLAPGETYPNTIFWYNGSLPISVVGFPTSLMDLAVWLPSSNPAFDSENDWFSAGIITFGEDFSFFDLEVMDYDCGLGIFETVSGRFSATPIPGAVWLLGSGIVGLAGLRRRMKA